MKRLVYAVSFLFIVSCLNARSEIRLPMVISDHAVLQRDRPIHIWGWATPGARIQAHFHEQIVDAETDALGKWSLYLRPESAGGPYILSLTGDGAETKVVDLLLGDVWLASGQSNMEMPLAGFPPTAFVKDADKEIAAGRNPKLRLLLVEHKASDFPVQDISSKWQQCTPETVKNFSAVAYFFGQEIAAKENVPIGLIDSTWGGTPADSWVSLDTLGTNPALLPAFASRATFADHVADADAQMAADKREDEAAVAAGRPIPSHPWHPSETSWLPAGLYNGMIAPLTPLTVKGFLWYQGETNSSHDRAPFYNGLFSSLIDDWRAHFAQGSLPFLFVQISSFNSPGEDWGTVRDQQRRTLHIVNTAMAVSLDEGQADNVHPPDKKTIGVRLATAARALAYGEDIPHQGPVFREATQELGEDGKIGIRIWFDHSEGLTYRGKGDADFEIAGVDHHFKPAQAQVQGSTVLVRSAAVSHPLYVRYGWAGVVTGYLYNTDGLPASTFSSEPLPAH